MITEADRFELHRALRDKLGNDVADTLMEHLPHGGWSTNTRTHDIDRLDDETRRRRRQTEEVFASIHHELDALRKSLYVFLGVMIITYTGIFIMLLRLKASIDSL